MGQGDFLKIQQTEAGNMFSSEMLLAANIHPETRLATDYLNHFNEVVMLFDLVRDMPELASEIAVWQPRSYADHFRASCFKGKDLAIAAYETVASDRRASFEETIQELDEALCSARDRVGHMDDPEIAYGVRATLDYEVKPLLARAMSLINGTPLNELEEVTPVEDPETSAAQHEVDALFG